MPQRLLQPGHRVALVVTCICAVLIFVSMGCAGTALFFRTSDQQNTNREICVAVNNLNSVISQTLKRSKKNLDKLSYYRTHPSEREQQRKEIDRTIRDFKPRTC